MMFEDAFGLKEEAEAIRAVVNKSLEQGFVTEDLAAKDAIESTKQPNASRSAVLLFATIVGRSQRRLGTSGCTPDEPKLSLLRLKSSILIIWSPVNSVRSS